MNIRSVLVAAIAASLFSTVGSAVHFYRGPDGGCTPADGAKGAYAAEGGATVLLLHTSYFDTDTGSPVTIIPAGSTVTWMWASSHCHSATGAVFDAGFHHPASEPETPAVAPGAAHYPVFDLTPTLSFTAQFDTPGMFQYACVHHGSIGMRGVVVVQ